MKDYLEYYLKIGRKMHVFFLKRDPMANSFEYNEHDNGVWSEEDT